MQILTLHSWSNAFDFEKLLHSRETQLIICTASCALSHWGLAGSTALTQTCAARDHGFLPHFYCLTLPQCSLRQTISGRIPRHARKKKRKKRETYVLPRVCYLMNADRSDRWLQSQHSSQALWRGEFPPTSHCTRRHAVRRGVSVMAVMIWSQTSCFTRVGSPVVPSGTWKKKVQD